MKKPKSVKGFLSGLVDFADSAVVDLRGSDKLPPEEYNRIVSAVAALQNELGEINDILNKYGMCWPPK